MLERTIGSVVKAAAALKNGRTWRLGLAALYLVAVLMAALLPDVHGVSAQPMEPASVSAVSVGCDDMNAVIVDDAHANCTQADHKIPDNCASGSLCHMAHLWMPTDWAVSPDHPVAAREMPPLASLPPGVARAPDLRPPRLSA